MQITMASVIEGVIRKGAGSTLFKGKQARGPLRTADFVYEIMIAVALELTDRLPIMFEAERQKHCKEQKFLNNYGNKGKYTDSVGWSKKHEFKHDFSLDPVFHHYFNRMIAPFLGGKKKGWCNENSKIWRWVKKLIISGDKEKIIKLQRNIKRRILKDAGRRITSYGANSTESSKEGIINTSGI